MSSSSAVCASSRKQDERLIYRLFRVALDPLMMSGVSVRGIEPLRYGWNLVGSEPGPVWPEGEVKGRRE